MSPPYPSSPSPPPSTPPPPTTHTLLSFPSPSILLITINRPRSLNALTFAAHAELGTLLTWYDHEPSLRCAIITGAGQKSFCAGQDLIELEAIRSGKVEKDERLQRHPRGGFGGISRRGGRKVVVAAVNGGAWGGGFEIVLGCDMVVASPSSSFSLPEALRGIYAAGGGPSRLVRTVGLPVATEIALTGRPISASRAYDLGLVNRISNTPESVVAEAVELAKEIAEISPDAAIVTRAALRGAWETGSVEDATRRIGERFDEVLNRGHNAAEGLRAFKEKRKPVWKPSKL